MHKELEKQIEAVRSFDELKSQNEFLQKNKDKGSGLSSFINAQSYIRGIRDLGYKSSSWACNELTDNAIQAGASQVHYFLTANHGKKSANKLFVIDDGHGMKSDMLPYAIAWGGTHRFNNRRGFGRYGFGLPSACVSMGQKYTLYSKTKDDDDWSSITFDLTKLPEQIDNLDIYNTVVDGPKKSELPFEVQDYESEEFHASQLKSGLIIEIEELDKLKPKNINELNSNFLRDFGLTYFPWLSKVSLYVNKERVLPLDPCFVTPGGQGYEWEKNNVKIIPDEKNYYESVIPIKVDEQVHQLIIRASKIPHNFSTPMDENGSFNKSSDSKSFRFRQLADYNGILFRRLGRLMDCVTKKIPGLTIMNNSRYWVCEIEFPPELDEEFEVTTSKQQLIPSKRIWDNIRDKSNNNIFNLLKKWTADYSQEKANFDKERMDDENAGERKKISEIKMEETKLRADVATEEFGQRVDKREERKNQKIDDLATSEGISVEQAKLKYDALYADHQYKVTLQKMSPRLPMFNFDEHGKTIELIINTGHVFFSKFYNNPQLSPTMRTNLETMLFCMADRIMPKPTRDQNFLEEYLADVSRRFGQILDENPSEDELSDQEAEQVQKEETLDDDLKDILEV